MEGSQVALELVRRAILPLDRPEARPKIPQASFFFG